MRSPNEDSQPSQTLARIGIITVWPVLMIEEHTALDVTVPDTYKYPSLKGAEMRSDLVVKGARQGRIHTNVCIWTSAFHSRCCWVGCLPNWCGLYSLLDAFG